MMNDLSFASVPWADFLPWLGLASFLVVGFVGVRFVLGVIRQADATSPNIIRPGVSPAAAKTVRPTSADRTKYGQTSIDSTYGSSVLPLVVVGAAAAWALSESSTVDSSCSFDASSSAAGE